MPMMSRTERRQNPVAYLYILDCEAGGTTEHRESCLSPAVQRMMEAYVPMRHARHAVETDDKIQLFPRIGCILAWSDCVKDGAEGHISPERTPIARLKNHGVHHQPH